MDAVFQPRRHLRRINSIPSPRGATLGHAALLQGSSEPIQVLNPAPQIAQLLTRRQQSFLFLGIVETDQMFHRFPEEA